MTKAKLTKLTNAELVRRFAEAAKKRGLAAGQRCAECHSGDLLYTCHRLCATRSWDRSQKELLPLLDSNDRFVRYYSAKNHLGIAPSQARAIIEWNYKHGLDAIAGMTLSNLDSGVSKPD